MCFVEFYHCVSDIMNGNKREKYTRNTRSCQNETKYQFHSVQFERSRVVRNFHFYGFNVYLMEIKNLFLASLDELQGQGCYIYH